jgi:rRNA maturation RNase YbeY
MPVLVQYRLRSVRLNHPSLVRVVRAILSAVRESSAELAVTFVGDRRMRRLNREYRKKDRSTDVLAFAMRDAHTPHTLRQAQGRPLCLMSRPLGDVVISIPTAQRQARQGGRSLDAELTVLLIHGILHLCGYDHERSESDARRMQRRERMILGRLAPLPKLVNRTPRE